MNKNESKYFNTAKKMNDALVALLEQKDFEFITVKDVCDRAKVNRSTFYLHYQSTADLLEEVVSNMNKSFCAHFGGVSAPDAKTADKSQLMFIDDEYLLPYLTFIAENKRVYKAIKHNPKLFSADMLTKQFYDDYFQTVLGRFGFDSDVKSHVFAYYVSGINALVMDWCANDCRLPVRQVAELIETLVLNGKRTN